MMVFYFHLLIYCIVYVGFSDYVLLVLFTLIEVVFSVFPDNVDGFERNGRWKLIFGGFGGMSGFWVLTFPSFGGFDYYHYYMSG